MENEGLREEMGYVYMVHTRTLSHMHMYAHVCVHTHIHTYALPGII